MEFVIAHATPGEAPGTLNVFGYVSSHAKLTVDVSGESPVATVTGEADRMSPRIKAALQNAVADAVAVAIKAKSDPRVAGESLERACVALKPTPRVEPAPSPAATPETQGTPVQALPVEPIIATAPAVEATPAKSQEAAAPVVVAPAPAAVPTPAAA